MELKLTILVNLVVCSTCWSWEAIPQIPTGHRTQYLVLRTDGGYKYGYDTGADSAAKQNADSSNQVEGHYFYTSPKGGKFDLKYTAGVQGFVPEGYGKTYQPSVYLGTNFPSYPVVYKGYQDNQAESGDASYSFNIDTDSYKRTETSDAKGNIQGSYSYTNDAGTHDVSYVAGEKSGFVATSGSLSKANGLPNSNDWKPFPSSQVPSTISTPTTYETKTITNPITTTNQIDEETQDDIADRGNKSYSFNIDTDDYKRTETSDAEGNVKGSFSYKSPVGTQDLSYIAGSSTGFVATGGSLSSPVEITKTIQNLPHNLQPVEAAESSSGDASYAFTIDTDEYKRHESSDAAGNVHGDYIYKNSVGNHDLSFVAGSATGFQPTGGSLSIAPGLNEAQLRQGQSNVVRLEAIPVAPATANQIWSDEKAKVFTYLPPSNEKGKFGYIYEVNY